MKVLSSLRTLWGKFGALAMVAFAALLPSFVKAEGESVAVPTADWDFGDAGDAVATMSTNIISFMQEKVIPSVLAVIAIAASLLLLYKIVRWIFKALFSR